MEPSDIQLLKSAYLAFATYIAVFICKSSKDSGAASET